MAQDSSFQQLPVDVGPLSIIRRRFGTKTTPSETQFLDANFSRLQYFFCPQIIRIRSKMATITIPSPFDAHVHLRQGDIAKLVVPHVALGGIKLAYVMVSMQFDNYHLQSSGQLTIYIIAQPYSTFDDSCSIACLPRRPTSSRPYD